MYAGVVCTSAYKTGSVYLGGGSSSYPVSLWVYAESVRRCNRSDLDRPLLWWDPLCYCRFVVRLFLLWCFSMAKTTTVDKIKSDSDQLFRFWNIYSVLDSHADTPGGGDECDNSVSVCGRCGNVIQRKKLYHRFF